MKRKIPIVAWMLVSIFAFAASQKAQEMEPRAYSRAPVGTNFVTVSYAYQTGDVLTDASLPLQDVKVKLNSATTAYGYTFGLAKKQANISAGLSYVRGNVTGTVFNEPHEITRS